MQAQVQKTNMKDHDDDDDDGDDDDDDDDPGCFGVSVPSVRSPNLPLSNQVEKRRNG